MHRGLDFNFCADKLFVPDHPVLYEAALPDLGELQGRAKVAVHHFFGGLHPGVHRFRDAQSQPHQSYRVDGVIGLAKLGRLLASLWHTQSRLRFS